MQRLLVGAAASRLRRCPRYQLPLTSGTARTRLPSPPITATAPYPIRSNLPTILNVQTAALSTNNEGALQSSPTANSPKKKLGLIAKIRHVVRTAFGYNDHTPRGIQERKDMYWIVLAAVHRNLRLENQRNLAQSSNEEHVLSDVKARSSQIVWREESNEQLKDMMDEAASHLDEKTDIGELSLLRLRTEMQSFLKPQIINLLAVAHDAEEKMISCHGLDGNGEEEYIFSEKEEQEYKQALLREYEDICRLLNEGKKEAFDESRKERRPDPVPFYEMKKGSIETVMSFFDWWPSDTKHHNRSPDADEIDYVDEFGFSPNMADSDILPAMRYYHVRNLVRSSFVRRTPVNADRNSDEEDDNTEQQQCLHSLLPFKSTVPSAGRGIFVDGFAPAGTLLAFLPGKVWPKEQLQTASIQTQMQLSENDPRDQLSMRYDDILIDSRHSPYTVVKNLWAVGHIVNHPPAPTATSTQFMSKPRSDKENDDSTEHNPYQGPSCGVVPINFTNQMLTGQERVKLRDYIPNEYEMPPKSWAKNAYDKDETIMHGLGLVALRDVKDEELFYDYRMSPDADVEGQGGGYPSWYYVWDREAISNRWDVDE